MLYIEQIVYSNKLRYLHPLERVVFALLTMFLAIFLKNWIIHLGIILTVILLLTKKAGIGLSTIIKLMFIPLGFLLIGVITIALQIGDQNLSYIYYIDIAGKYFGVTQTSLEMAFQTLTVSLSAVSCLYFLALTTPMVELIYVLQIFRIPEIIIELMVIIYRFIFVFINTAFSIYYAQQSRYGYSSFKKSINSFAILIGNLWGKAFFKSQNLLVSLESRGFEGNLKVLNPEYTFSAKYIIGFAFIDIAILILGIFIFR